jgi:hypothetical protein
MIEGAPPLPPLCPGSTTTVRPAREVADAPVRAESVGIAAGVGFAELSAGPGLVEPSAGPGAVKPSVELGFVEAPAVPRPDDADAEGDGSAAGAQPEIARRRPTTAARHARLAGGRGLLATMYCPF